MPKSSDKNRKKKAAGTDQPYSLVEQLERDSSLKPMRHKAKRDEDEDGREEEPLSKKMASKIMEVAREQRAAADEATSGRSGAAMMGEDDDG